MKIVQGIEGMTWIIRNIQQSQVLSLLTATASLPGESACLRLSTNHDEREDLTSLKLWILAMKEALSNSFSSIFNHFSLAPLHQTHNFLLFAEGRAELGLFIFRSGYVILNKARLQLSTAKMLTQWCSFELPNLTQNMQKRLHGLFGLMQSSFNTS